MAAAQPGEHEHDPLLEQREQSQALPPNHFIQYNRWDIFIAIFSVIILLLLFWAIST